MQKKPMNLQGGPYCMSVFHLKKTCQSSLDGIFHKKVCPVSGVTRGGMFGVQSKYLIIGFAGCYFERTLKKPL